MRGDISRDTFDATKHYDGVVMQQGRAQIDADWNEQQDIHRHRAGMQARDIVGPGGGAPLHAAGFQLSVNPDGKSVTIGAGRYYADGLLLENDSAVDYGAQPDYPNAPGIASLMSASGGATAVIFYLAAFRRDVGAIDDPSIRESALGGPDTALRAKTVWQVKALPVKPASPGGAYAPNDVFPEWDALVAPASGALSARANPAAASDNPCLIPPGGGYRGLDNLLYRVEAHKPGPLAGATFKWSRDNGAVLTKIEAFSGAQLTVHDIGPDDSLGFANGQWVELIDDATELSGQPCPLFQIDAVDPATRIVTLKSAPNAVDPSLHPKLRRWDSAGDVSVTAPAGGDGWIALENGVEVQFAPGTYNTGDTWLIPARTATGGVEWPYGAPVPPRGEPRRFLRLGIAAYLDSALVNLLDCRRFFAPLAEVPPALHITGASWANDDVLPQEQMRANGLKIFLDGPPNSPLAPPAGTPGDWGGAPLDVTLEARGPLPGVGAGGPAAAFACFKIALAGDLSAAPDGLLWKPVGNGVEISNIGAFLVAQQVSMARVRVRLHGSALWNDSSAPTRYLDGRAAGQLGLRADRTPRVDLAFPSGEGRRFSDFDSWFYLQLQLPPSLLAKLTVANAVMNPGDTVAASVELDHPAPAPGVTVTLTCASTFLQVPKTVVVAAGQTVGQFSIVAPAVAAGQNTSDYQIRASAPGAPDQTATMRVQVVTVSLSPAEVTIWTGHAQQFAASVSGADDASVVWSVKEANGGGVNTNGLYVAPTATGDYHLVATSNANAAISATATVHVQVKPKDKDKEKEKDKDKEKEKERIKDKIGALEKLTKESDKLMRAFASGLDGARSAIAVDGLNGDETDAKAGEDLGRAFILPEERPDVSPRPSA